MLNYFDKSPQRTSQHQPLQQGPSSGFNVKIDQDQAKPITKFLIHNINWLVFYSKQSTPLIAQILCRIYYTALLLWKIKAFQVQHVSKLITSSMASRNVSGMSNTDRKSMAPPCGRHQHVRWVMNNIKTKPNIRNLALFLKCSTWSNRHYRYLESKWTPFQTILKM